MLFLYYTKIMQKAAPPTDYLMVCLCYTHNVMIMYAFFLVLLQCYDYVCIFSSAITILLIIFLVCNNKIAVTWPFFLLTRK